MDAPRVLDAVPLAIDPDEVLRFQGYKAGVDIPSAAVRALFDEALALGRTLMQPRAVLRTLPVRREGDRLTAAGVTLTIPHIAERWGAVDEIVAGVCTIGDALERRASELWDARELPLAMMVDSVGSAAVESLAEYANDLLCQAAIPGGVKVTNRVSPGYAGWDAGEQASLFRLCPGGPIGVTLNEACVMTPGKSISFLVGVGPAARVDHSFTQCRRCWMRDCAYRRAPAALTVRR